MGRSSGGCVDLVALEDSGCTFSLLPRRPFLNSLTTIVPLYLPSTVCKCSFLSTLVTWSSSLCFVISSFESFAYAIRPLSPFWLEAGGIGTKELLIRLLIDLMLSAVRHYGWFQKHLFNLQRSTIFVFLERPYAFRISFTSLNRSVTKYGVAFSLWSTCAVWIGSLCHTCSHVLFISLHSESCSL